MKDPAPSAASAAMELIGQLNGQWIQFTEPNRLVTSAGWQIVSDDITVAGVQNAPETVRIQGDDNRLKWGHLTADLDPSGDLVLQKTGEHYCATVTAHSPWALRATMGAAMSVNGTEIGVHPATGYVYATDANMKRWHDMPVTENMLAVLSYTEDDWILGGEFMWPWPDDDDEDLDALTRETADLIGAVLAKGLIHWGTVIDGSFVPAPMTVEQQIEHVLTQWFALGAQNVTSGFIAWFDSTPKGNEVLVEYRKSHPGI